MAAEVPAQGLKVLALGGLPSTIDVAKQKLMVDRWGWHARAFLSIDPGVSDEGINPQNPPKPCDYFDMIGGTSTGGLIAIMLARLQMTIPQAIDAYLELSRIVFAPKHRFNFIKTLANVAKAQGRCDSKALRDEIRKLVATHLGAGQEDALLTEESPVCRTFVCAIRREKRALMVFRSFEREGYADLEATIWQAARATSAATTFFDPVSIGKYKQEFVDGGAGFNCPVDVAFKEARAAWNDPPRDIHCIISIGTGKLSLKPFGGNLKQVGQTLRDIATRTDEIAAKFGDDHPELTDEQQRYFRFQVEDGLDTIGLAEHDKIKEMATATQIYMETSDSQGLKQLKTFKEMVGRPRPVTRFKMTSVSLTPAQIRYLEKHESELGLQAPALMAHNGRPDYNSGTIRLPRSFFTNAEAYVFYVYLVELDGKLVWPKVLRRFGEADLAEPPHHDIPVHEAVWYEGYGGVFALEIPVADIWRIVGSFNPFYSLSNIIPSTPTEIHAHDLWLSVPDTLHDKPLVRMDIRHGTITTDSRSWVPNHDYAAAMCGIGGLPPTKLGTHVIFRSEVPHWGVIRQPLCFAFTLLPVQNRVFFPVQWDWLCKHSFAMYHVCRTLWEHAEAIDLDRADVPVTVRVRELRQAMTETDSKLEPHSRVYMDKKIDRSYQVAERHMSTDVMFTQAGSFVEIEDAVMLLEKSTTYTEEDFRPLNADGENEVIRDWWGFFGEARALDCAHYDGSADQEPVSALYGPRDL